jgi:hypothetical protein
MHGGDVRRIDGDRFEIELPLVDAVKKNAPH